MKKFFAYIRNLILILAALYATSLFVDIRIEGVPLNTIYDNAFRETYKFIDSMIDRIKSEPEVTELVITRDTETGLYSFDATIRYVDKDEFVSIEIDDVTYTDFTVVSNSRNIVVSIILPVEFEAGNANKQFDVTGITYLRNGEEKVLETSVTGTAFKSIDTEIVASKKISVVGISACDAGEFTITCTSWGSGVIFESESRVIDAVVDYTEYDYYIMTNAHVANGGNTYEIYYNNAKLNDRASLVGTYTEGADLAILKLTTRASLVVLEDAQFETKEAIPIYKGQTVFSIGSPEGPQNFNTVKEGVITNLNVPVVLEDETELCQTACYAFQTDAALGAGSSGGAMFDSAGNLVGIHFAGDKENTISSEIPMSKVFEAIEAILGA
jgi:S1-C subfamily serine protease